jgi:hypothetical protein
MLLEIANRLAHMHIAVSGEGGFLTMPSWPSHDLENPLATCQHMSG